MKKNLDHIQGAGSLKIIPPRPKGYEHRTNDSTALYMLRKKWERYQKELQWLNRRLTEVNGKMEMLQAEIEAHEERLNQVPEGQRKSVAKSWPQSGATWKKRTLNY